MTHRVKPQSKLEIGTGYHNNDRRISCYAASNNSKRTCSSFFLFFYDIPKGKKYSKQNLNEQEEA